MGPGPPPNTIRVQMNRGNLTEGNVVHVSYLKHFVACEARYWYDPVPNLASSFAEVENGAWPGDLERLTPSQLDELSEKLRGSNPLVPSVLPRSEFFLPGVSSEAVVDGGCRGTSGMRVLQRVRTF